MGPLDALAISGELISLPAAKKTILQHIQKLHGQGVFELHFEHLLTGEELSREQLSMLLDLARILKAYRAQLQEFKPLAGKTLALVFDKPSLRTRASFTVAMQELGGQVIECAANNRKEEEPEDVSRVLSGYVHAAMVRTFEQEILTRMAKVSKIPLINGLSDEFHPCQVLADLLTLKERFSSLESLKLAYIGDGNNMLHSILMLAPLMGIHVHYSCPEKYSPAPFALELAQKTATLGGGKIESFRGPLSAVEGVDAIYTDVFASMGFEAEKLERERAFIGYQVNQELYAHAGTEPFLMHCLPMNRGEEISYEMAEHPKVLFFDQSENRLHVQKAILLGLVRSFGKNE